METLITDPVAVDTELVQIDAGLETTQNLIRSTLDTIHRYIGDTKRTIVPTTARRRAVTDWTMDDAAALAQARAAGAAQPWNATALRDVLTRYGAHAAHEAELAARALELDTIYRARPWPRFFLVQDGHVHSSMHCSTCNNGLHSTRFARLPRWSGRTEAEAINGLRSEGGNQKAAIMCTVCYPSAPVEWTTAPVDSSVCTGTYTYDRDARTTRFGKVSGNCATCTECGKAGVALSTAGKLRKHTRP